MLKIVKTSLVIAASTLAFSNAAQANDINEALANICTIVQADDKGELRKKMRSVQSDYKLKLRDYYSGISCNGQSLIRTALTSNAVEVGTLLLRKCQAKTQQSLSQTVRHFKRGSLNKVFKALLFQQSLTAESNITN